MQRPRTRGAPIARAQVLERDFAGDAYEDRDLVFANELGGPIGPRWLSDRFHQLRWAAGIPTGSLHVLRHTHATILLTNRIPVHMVAARLGDRAETVLATYAHLLPQSDEQAAERMAGRSPGSSWVAESPANRSSKRR
jgi:integrase